MKLDLKHPPKLQPGPFTRSFQNTEDEALYHQLMMMIQLTQVSHSEFEEIANGKINLDNLQKAGTFEHELTHFIDHISTLHGQ